jgi:hypothetical protein
MKQFFKLIFNFIYMILGLAMLAMLALIFFFIWFVTHPEIAEKMNHQRTEMVNH